MQMAASRRAISYKPGPFCTGTAVAPATQKRFADSAMVERQTTTTTTNNCRRNQTQEDWRPQSCANTLLGLLVI